jgi:hypothetical protein
MQIDAVQQRPSEFAQVALDDGAGAAAFARGITDTPVFSLPKND